MEDSTMPSSSRSTSYWTQKQTSLLIKLFRRQEHLYNSNHPDYRNEEKRQKAFSTILNSLKSIRNNLTINEIEKKLKNLQSSFFLDVEKIEEKKSKLKGGHDTELTSLWYYKQLKFLKDYFQTKRSNTKQKKYADSQAKRREKCGEFFIDKNGQFVFICFQCGQEYAKAKHLLKHILTECFKTYFQTHFVGGNKDFSQMFIKEELTNEIEDYESYNQFDLEPDIEIKDQINNSTQICDQLDNTNKDFNLKLMNESSDVNDSTQSCDQFDDTNIDFKVEFLDSSSDYPSTAIDDEKPYKCEKCDEQFSSERQLIDHNENHKDDFDEVKKNTCLECNKTFTSIRRYNTHVKNTHVENSCTICGLKCTNKYNANLHMRRMHTDTQSKYFCEICNYGCKEKRNLEDHIRTHTKEKPFNCDRCGKSFGSSTYLNVHRRLHDESEKKYCCEKCGARFVNNAKLNTHVKRKHNTVKMYKCDKCSETYIQLETLKKHQIKHYDGSFVCKICNHDCHTRDWLRDHKCFSQKRPPRVRPVVILDAAKNIETIISSEKILNDRMEFV